jgi:hypothetical protein
VSYQVDVVADSVADAVRHAGGLMFDRGRIGWRISVVTDDTAHCRALTILGVHRELPGAREQSSSGQDRVVRCLVLPAKLLTANPHAIAVENAMPEPPAELLLWGPYANGELTDQLCPVRYELSAAARMFKAEALRSMGTDVRVEPAETFWAGEDLDSVPSGRNLRTSPSVVGESPHG